MSTDLRDLSRIKWATEGKALEHINCGSLLRIADATELMAKRHQELITERDRFKASLDHWRGMYGQMAYSNRSLRGQITKLRKQIEALKNV